MKWQTSTMLHDQFLSSSDNSSKNNTRQYCSSETVMNLMIESKSVKELTSIQNVKTISLKAEEIADSVRHIH